jgi:hypothetical protein
MNWQAEILCVFVGTATSASELLTLQFHPADSASVTEHKRLLVKLLATALLHRREVRVHHGDSDPVVLGVEFLLSNISPVGPAIHNDFYAVTGNNIPSDAVVVFDSPVFSVAVTPDLHRSYWLFIEQLPSAIPEGPCLVFLRAAGWQSDSVPITVTSGQPATVRTLYSGRPATTPYTFVFAASPAIEGVGAIAPDSILTDRAGFNQTVRHCLENLLTVTEGILRTDNLEQSVRFVAIFDTTQSGLATANALVRQISPNLLEPVRDRLNNFVGRYWENPDIVYCVSGSTTYTRASAWFTTDDGTKDGVDFTYDGVTRKHRRYTDIPGSAAISTALITTGLTAIHEFCHAASDFNNGMVIDLYVDGTRTGFVVNKKNRAQASDAIPATFANYGGTSFQSDQNRDGLGYPATWTSYHPELRDTGRPNLMDNYWLAADPQRCQLDLLTFNWFRDRLRAKVLR